jgi:DNA invertase Pin-like site-specific DNA recombinase
MTKPKTTCTLISYLRVSTKGQGESGLGLEAQQAAVETYRQSVGCQIVAEYQEIESGKKNDRTELAKAIAHAKRIKATLVIAKLDRLARNVYFIAGLLEAGVDFVACDCPDKDRFMIHLRASFAEEEGRKISERTKAGLEAAKARGTVLGGYRAKAAAKLTPEIRARGAKAAGVAHRAAAMDAYADLVPKMETWRSEGLSLGKIAGKLNDEGHTTRTGTKWSPVQVMRALDRAK